MRAALIGNYGVGNLGDEALKDYFHVRFTDIEWVTLTAAPTKEQEVPRLPSGIRSFIGFKWVRTLRALRSCDAVVFGGGSLFTDVESPFACFLWWIHAFAATLMGKPIFFAFQGIGPFKTGMGRWFAKNALQKGVFISVRDEASARRLVELGLSQNIVQTFDPVFLLLGDVKKDARSQKMLSIIPRRNSSESLKNQVRNLAESKEYDVVQILSMQPGDPHEKRTCNELSALTSGEVIAVQSLKGLSDRLQDSALVITERYHGGLAALALGCPVTIISQGAGDKLAELESIKQLDHEELQNRVLRGEQTLKEALIAVSRS